MDNPNDLECLTASNEQISCIEKIISKDSIKVVPRKEESNLYTTETYQIGYTTSKRLSACQRQATSCYFDLLVSADRLDPQRNYRLFCLGEEVIARWLSKMPSVGIMRMALGDQLQNTNPQKLVSPYTILQIGGLEVKSRSPLLIIETAMQIMPIVEDLENPHDLAEFEFKISRFNSRKNDSEITRYTVIAGFYLSSKMHNFVDTKIISVCNQGGYEAGYPNFVYEFLKAMVGRKE